MKTLFACLTCDQPFSNEVLTTAIEEQQQVFWCSIACKETFYRHHFAESGLAKNIELELATERERYRHSPEHIRFMERVKAVGFSQALHEVKK